MFHSIRWRIALPYVILILLTMLGVGLYVTSFVRQTYLNDLEAGLTAEARLASEIVAPMLASGKEPAELDILARRWAGVLDSRVTIIARDGTVIGESHEDRTQMDNHLNRPEIQDALTSGQGTSIRFSQTILAYMMYVAVPVVEDGDVVGFARISMPLENIDKNITHLQQTLIAVTFAIALVTVVLALWIASRSMQPLRNLTRDVGRISTGDLESIRIPNQSSLTSQDEIGQLTRSFNSMTIQLRGQLQTLEAERSKMAAVLGVITDGVLIVDENGVVQLINPAAENMFAVKEKDAVGRSVVEVLRHHQLVELWQRSLELDDSQITTLELHPQRLYLQGIATPLGQALPGRTLLLFQNLTRLRRLETVRQDFISNISHELRTPLTSLKALTETLQESALDDPPAARRFLQRMETEVDALSLMVSELLELSRIESGRVPLKMQPIQPVELIKQAEERLRLQAERAELKVSLDAAEDLPLVLADPSRLEQVLVNLLHNAIKFTPSGGQIRVTAQAQGDHILFAVEDTGVGIPADDLPRIFERFYKADRARSGGGTGLGLAIARHLVEAHGGTIWAESVEGKGSTFCFTIPVSP
jgi:two-component system phosphate regulon sensor histidine kinase PhoR